MSVSAPKTVAAPKSQEPAVLQARSAPERLGQARPAADLLHLHGVYGNGFVQRLLKRAVNAPATGRLVLQRKCACGAGAHGLTDECAECSTKNMEGLQTKLRINEPGDAYEQEADRVADQVMATRAHPVVNRTPPPIQRFTAGQQTGQAEAAPASVDQALASPGRSLEPALRLDMEQRLGHDFSKVRLHSDAVAVLSARDLNANAYTVGHDIVFGGGQYAPGTNDGRRLIAHELTHVVQQSGSQGMLLPSPQTVQRQRSNYPAAGCATCRSASAAGSVAHPYALGLFVKSYKRSIVTEAPVRDNPYDDNGRLDLFRRTDMVKWPKLVEYGEIKPDNDAGVSQGRRDLDWYGEQLSRIFEPPEWLVSRLDVAAPQDAVSFKDNTLPQCPDQRLSVRSTKIVGHEPGLYLYKCDPPGRPGVALAPCCSRTRDTEDEPPVAVDRAGAQEGDPKSTSETKGKGNGKRPESPGAQPRWAPEISATLATVIAGLAGLALLIAKYFKPARLAVLMGTLIGSLLKWLGIGLAVAGGAAVASAAGSSPSVSGRRRRPPVGPAADAEVRVPRAVPPAPTTVPPAKEGRSTEGVHPLKLPEKTRVIKVGVIDGLNPEQLSIGMLRPVWLYEKRNPSEKLFAMLQVTNKVREGNDTTVQFKSLLENRAGRNTLGGNVYTVTHPHRGPGVAAWVGALAFKGDNAQFVWNYIETLASELEHAGLKIEAEQVRTEVQRMKQR